MKQKEQSHRWRQEAIEKVRVLKRENLPRIGDPYWASPTGYNYGSWADRGFNIALKLLQSNEPEEGEKGSAYLQRVNEVVREQRDRFSADERDEDGACSGALEAAFWAISEVAQKAKEASDRQAFDSKPENAAWRLMYWDAFDREMPPQEEAKGKGLEKGLAALWSHFLAETVQPSGFEGFTRFFLAWDGPGASIRQVTQGAVRLRGWVFSESGKTRANHTASKDKALIALIAQVHFALLQDPDPAVRILATADEVTTRNEFESRMRALLAGR